MYMRLNLVNFYWKSKCQILKISRQAICTQHSQKMKPQTHDSVILQPGITEWGISANPKFALGMASVSLSSFQVPVTGSYSSMLFSTTSGFLSLPPMAIILQNEKDDSLQTMHLFVAQKSDKLWWQPKGWLPLWLPM